MMLSRAMTTAATTRIPDGYDGNSLAMSIIDRLIEPFLGDVTNYQRLKARIEELWQTGASE